jgi:rhamnogalacturonyl hydrolase YesR
MNPKFLECFESLKAYCEKEEFKGWDPYDGLTSRLFQSLPIIRNNRLARLAWIQFFKRSPINLRPLLQVKKSYNAKGLALFLTGYCHLYKLEGRQEYLDRIHFLSEKLITLQSPGYSGSCWGYYFDWQARAFFQPAYTPTVVATSFVTEALIQAYELTRKGKYLETAISSADFVLKDLNRTKGEQDSFCFSYSPLDHTQVFNASLLGARLLAHIYQYTGNVLLKEEAGRAIRYVCGKQQDNGAWAYGTLPFHDWIDNFHTGFNLECISDYQQFTGDQQFRQHIEKGFGFYVNNFFEEDGASKYYHNKRYPIDIHAPAQLMVTLCKLDHFDRYRPLADKVLQWTIDHMRSPQGFFYYQKKKWSQSRIPYMRWAQAWMFYAMSYYLIYANKMNEHGKTGLFAGHAGA